MGLTLKQMLINEIETQHGRANELALIAGYSNGSALKKALKKESGDIEKFDGFVKLVHELFPDNKFELMTAFAETLNPQTMTCRFMVEYATLYGLKELKLNLITRLQESSNKESNDWAFVYDTELKQYTKEITSLEAIDLLTQRKYISAEMKIYSKFVLFYIYYNQRNVYMMEALCNDIKSEIDSLKKKFTKDTYYARLFLIECSVDLHNKKMGDVREKLFLMESALDPLKGMVYLNIGNSYMLTNYEKANNLYKQALEYASEKIKPEIRKSINFNNILWDKFEAYLPDGDKSNELFYYAKKGQVENGKRLLEKLDTSNYSNHQYAFHYYYQALLFKDSNLLFKSVEFFAKAGEKFYKMLPILELKKQGVNSFILDALSA